MRTRLILAMTAMAVIIAACGSGGERTLDGPASDIFSGPCAESAGEEVTIYSGRTKNLIEPVLDAFACESGVDVQVRWGDSADLALILAEEGDKTEADVFLSRSPGPIGFLESRELLGSIDDATLGLVEEQNRSSSGSWVGFSGRKRVMVYNSDMVGDDELPESIFDLTGEAYRDRVAIPATNGSFVDWFTVFRDQHGNDVAEQWLADMVANGAQSYSNNRAIVEAAGRGEIDMGLVNHYYNYQESIASGDDHRGVNHNFDDGDIGSLLLITAAAVPAATDQTESANQLIEYLLSAPVQTYFTTETFEYPLASGVDAASVLPELDALEIGTVDFDRLGGGFEQSTSMIERTGILNQ